MASSSSVPAIILSVLVLVITPSYSQTCKTQKFKSPDKTFDNCEDLPVLSASLHYSYNASNSSLSIAFVAPPAKPDGWVAWAINPTSTGMVGAQTLIAFALNGKLTVNPVAINSYSSFKPGLSFDVWDLSAESDGNTIVIFAAVKVPEKAESVNTVWQVGPSVNDKGVPEKHELGPDNLKAKSVLQLSSDGAAAPGPGGSNTGGGGAPPPTGGKSGGYRSVASYVGGLFGLMVGSLVM